jgi:hypothetical protein
MNFWPTLYDTLVFSSNVKKNEVRILNNEFYGDDITNKSHSFLIQ